MKKLRYLCLLALVLLLPVVVFGEEKPDDKKEADDQIIETTHTVTIQGKNIPYLARTGTIVMKKEDGTPRAKLFFIAYEKENVENKADRPVTFAFNGGPGSSSVWLHLGILGPKRVDLDKDGYPTALPFTLVENNYSILDQTDLVFIDPISTGFSRVINDTNPNEFHGVREDIESVGEFIRLYTTRYERWQSPKFLAGESYGTTRASGLSNFMLDRYGMYFNGVVLVSSVLDFQTINFSEGNDLPYIMFLPSYTATAWYHQKLSADYQQQPLLEVLDEARQFAMNEYALALLQGNKLDPDRKSQITRRLAQLTGVSEDYVDQSNLRVNIFGFTKELLRDERRTVGRFDSRYKGYDKEARGERHDYDPSYTVIQGAYTAALNHYIRSELKFESDLPYEILTGRVHPWNWSQFTNRYVNVAEDLRDALTKNPYMNVMVQCGYYDLATPYLAAEYTFDHFHLPPPLASHVQFTYYEAGHMMYLHTPSLEAMKQDMDAFYQQTLEQTQKPIPRY